jgi:predicted RNA-binding Zn-ribbon protein involved in translation (DUF1610 family)
MCGVKLTSSPSLDKPANDLESKDQATPPATTGERAEPEVEELDLTALDDEAKTDPGSVQETTGTDSKPKEQKTESAKGADNVIDLKEILESDEKKELDNSIKREVLADDEEFFKVCPMCGEEMNINKNLLENTPVLVKCLKCGNETKIW